MTEVLGWASSFILVLTIGRQVYRQWKSGTSEGVSKWLFVGQCAASLGFTVYSWLVHNWVFVVTNGLMLVNALLGLFIVRHHRKRGNRAGHPHVATQTPDSATPSLLSSPVRLGA